MVMNGRDVTRARLDHPKWTALVFVLFACLFITADQASPFAPVRVEDWTADFLAAARGGSAQRQTGYILIAVATVAFGLTVRRRPNTSLHRGGVAAVTCLLAWAAASAFWSAEPDMVIRRLAVLGIAIGWVYIVA